MSASSYPALFMTASTASADPLLRHACGRRARPSDRQRTAVSTPPVFGAPRAGLATRLGAFVTNRHE